MSETILIGDHPSMGTKLYYNTLRTQEDAQAMVDLLTEHLNLGHYPIGKVKVIFTKRITKHRYGLFFRHLMLIKIHKIGQNEGTILHELAHIVDPGHGKIFKAMQLHLKTLWERR